MFESWLELAEVEKKKTLSFREKERKVNLVANNQITWCFEQKKKIPFGNLFKQIFLILFWFCSPKSMRLRNKFVQSKGKFLFLYLLLFLYFFIAFFWFFIKKKKLAKEKRKSNLSVCNNLNGNNLFEASKSRAKTPKTFCQRNLLLLLLLLLKVLSSNV